VLLSSGKKAYSASCSVPNRSDDVSAGFIIGKHTAYMYTLNISVCEKMTMKLEGPTKMILE